MPIMLEVVEPQIHLGKWIGDIRLGEIFEATKITQKHAIDNGYRDYVFIIDAREFKSIPFEIRMLGKAAQIDNTALAYVVLGAPSWTRSVTRLVSLFSPQDYIHVDDYDVAIQTARDILQKQQIEP